MADIEKLEKQLDSFSEKDRAAALRQLAEAMNKGEVKRHSLTGWINCHAHTFFSFNAMGYSPSRLVWESVKRGLDVVSSVDFDVLDAMDEMFSAGDLLGLRTVAALESRVFVESYADRDINSPGEPGVWYYMGVGFCRLPDPGSQAERTLRGMRDQATARNRALIDRVNPAMSPAAIDYDKDVLPLTPSGNATERHILAAYDAKARSVFADPAKLAHFWAEKLAVAPDAAQKLLGDTAGLRNTIRSKLMKRGGVGYVQPGRDTFPPLAEVVRMIADSQAIPAMAWLDGSSAGEADPGRLLDDSLAWGCLCANLVPDRNWNIANPEAKEKKVKALKAFIEACRARDLPLLAGTEMNNYGLKFVDDFDAPELQPYAKEFKEGAYWVWGHTLMQRAMGCGVTSPWAKKQFGSDRARSNAFYLKVGETAQPGPAALAKLAALSKDSSPETILKNCS